MRIAFRVLAFMCTVSCAAPQANQISQSGSACEEARRKSGAEGEYFRASDGTPIYFERGGPASGGTPVIYLHGGPGYNSYAFRRAVGAQLEKQLPMIYLDQRGAGRSWSDGPPEKFGMKRTVDDLDDLRRHLGAQKLRLIAHSFGGLVALEYALHHPNEVDSIVLVDIAPDLHSVFEHQVEFANTVAASVSPQVADKVASIARGPEPIFEKLMGVYSVLGAHRLQARMHYGSAEAHARNEALDTESGLRACAPTAAVSALASSGYLDSHHEELQRRLPLP